MCNQNEPGDWITVPAMLIQEAAALLTPPNPTRTETIDVPPNLLRAMIETLGEDTFCDHEVNICMCPETDAVYELGLALDGKLVCQQCGGEGHTWDHQQAAITWAQDAEKYGIPFQDARHEAPFAGNVNCPGCNGHGITRINPKEETLCN